MALAYEQNTDLAFNTEVLKQAANRYDELAKDIREITSELDNLILDLRDKGWTTSAGKIFYEMTKTNWSQNMEKYAALLETMGNILKESADKYDELMNDYVRKTKVKE